MQLIKDEVVVREFEYATVNRGGNQTSCSVTVTNKRVFTTDATKRKVAHTEVPLSKVKRMDATFKAPNNWPAYMCIAYAVMCFLLSLVAVVSGWIEDQPDLIWLFLAVVVVWLLSAWAVWQWPSFKWSLSTVGVEGKPLYTSIAKLIPTKGRIGRTRVHLNRQVCEEFTYSIGAAIAEARILAEQDGQKAE